MEKWNGRVALVTGANSGVGEAVSQKLLKLGMTVVGVDKHIANIQKNSKMSDKKGKLVAMKCDLTKDEEVFAIFDQIKKQYKGVDLCINNAGVLYRSPLLSGDPVKWREMSNVNVVALCLVAKLSVESMRERNVEDGHIINTCSYVGHHVLPLSDFHFYSSTKYAVKALTEGLRQELEEAKSKIRVSQVSPGIVKTNLYSEFSADEFDNLAKAFPPLKPEEVADVIIQILSHPPNIEVRELIVMGK